MSTPLPVSFRVSALNPTASYTPQQFADAIAARLSLDTDEALSLFVSGSTAPTTDSGPWLKDGVTWWVWDPNTGAYIPQPLDSLSLKYIASQSAPDANKYTFWIEIAGDGSPKSIKYFFSGNWVDIYDSRFANYPTIAQMNTAIANSQTTYPFRAGKDAGVQNYTAGSGDVEVTFNTEIFDPRGVFSANKFTAPIDGYYTFTGSISIAVNSGTPTAIDRQLKLAKNGIAFARSVVQQSDADSGLTILVSGSVQLNQGDQVNLLVYVTSTGASTWDIADDVTITYFEGHRMTN